MAGTDDRHRADRAHGCFPDRHLLFARETTGSVVAFAVDPAQPDLLAQVNEVLGAMADDGTYQQIYDRWFEDGAGSAAASQT